MRMEKSDKIIVTGGAGFLGSFVCELLKQRGYTNLFVPRKKDVDLTSEAAVDKLYREQRPAVVMHLAAEVGDQAERDPQQ